ncbi:MAG: hypothetical protein PHZ19_03645 [Candidatus Thermoplasmatota archaeon]|nr:hypothetical protein [Candidatus Thermoplasmatota archaeon]
MVQPTCDIDCLVCASYFEFNINGETFRELYQKYGGSRSMADHMWGKFTDHHHSILHVIGVADTSNREILTRMITDWCREHPPEREKQRGRAMVRGARR